MRVKTRATISGGTALATARAAPLGSFPGSLIDWRGAFLRVVTVAAGLALFGGLARATAALLAAGCFAGTVALVG